LGARESGVNKQRADADQRGDALDAPVRRQSPLSTNAPQKYGGTRSPAGAPADVELE
jgi:hypothetical protein